MISHLFLLAYQILARDTFYLLEFAQPRPRRASAIRKYLLPVLFRVKNCVSQAYLLFLSLKSILACLTIVL